MSGPAALILGGGVTGAASQALSPDADVVDTLAGGALGAVTGGVANALPAPIKNKLASATAGGLIGAFSGLTHGGTMGERVENALTGFALGAATGKLAGIFSQGQPAAVRAASKPVVEPGTPAAYGKVGGQAIGPRAVEIQKMGIDLPAASFAEELAPGAMQRASTVRSTPEHAAAYAEQQLRTRISANKYANNSALEAIGEKLPDNVAPGIEAGKYVKARIGERYNEILPKVEVNMTDDLAAGLQKTAQKASASSLNDAARNDWEHFVKTNIYDTLEQGTINGTQLKKLRATIDDSIQAFAGKRETVSYANALRKMRGQILESVDAQLEVKNPGLAPRTQGH